MNSIRDYGQDQELAKQFLNEFTHVTAENEVVNKYASILTDIANRKAVHLYVHLADLEQFNQDLAEEVKSNMTRYVKIFAAAMDEILPNYKTAEAAEKDSLDTFIEQRLLVAERHQRTQASGGTNQTSSQQTRQMGSSNRSTFVVNENKYPPELIRRAEVSFKPSKLDTIPIREVLSEHVGHLVTIRGIVTRTTDVKMKVSVVTYTCDLCGCESFQPVSGMDFNPLFECTSSVCKNNKTIGKVCMQSRGSKFVKFQEIKLQEHSDQVPTGHLPRSITVHAHGELTRLCGPGDHISVSGIFLTIEKSAYRARTGGLAADTFIEAQYITKMNKTEDDELKDDAMTMEEAFQLADGQQNFIKKLSSSIAPEIWGHDELKKALLLLLVGGVDRSPQGMKIRGNINICLMGDPGVAKSQLLSFIDRLASRSQYTTGRGSSGVGLTAAVLKDPVTNELILEGGALVLADQGICCIDEFDKMMDADRTAIHEVMEQQTVSIAKAGILTTLNARVSILAAANPAYGRYNPDRSITDNLQLPPALLSRFDLLWLIRDKPDQAKDLELAQHITLVHKNPEIDIPCEYEPLDMKDMRRYINLCKQKNPVVPDELEERMVKIYLDIRERKRSDGREDALFTSPRSLLAIIRLATAFARLRLSDVVEEPDVEAAVDLYNCSRESIEGAIGAGMPTHALLMNILQEMCASRNVKTVSIDDLYSEAGKRGLREDQISDCLELLDEFQSIERDAEDITLVS